MEHRIVFHIDVNSAFLSWEAVDRLQHGETLDLREIPSAVGGDPKTRRGIISARSIPAKKMGVKSGDSVVNALRICPDLVLVPGNFRLYSRMSKAFIAICREYTSLLEQYSVDECFLDMTHAVKDGNHEDAVKLADTIRERIYQELGFTVNVGVSENKLLAKMASDFLKPNRTHTLWPEEIEKKMWPLPAGDLLYVGKSSSRLLEKLGVRTIGDIAALPLSVLIAHAGEKGGIMLYNSSHGIDRSRVTGIREDEKSYSHSITMPVDIVDAEEAKRILRQLSDETAERLRKDNVRAGLVTVTIRGNEYDRLAVIGNGFKDVSKQRKIGYYTYASDLLYEEVVRLFTEIWDKIMPIRLLGVAFSDIQKDGTQQMDFLTDDRREKKEKLDRMVDTVRGKFGRGAIQRLGSLQEEKQHDAGKEK